MTDQVAAALDRFFERAVAAQPDESFKAPFDPEFRSESEVGRDGDFVRWQPVRQTNPVDFAGLENALEFAIHPAIKTWYGRYWAGGVDATATEGHVSLIQLWNFEDYERLIGNLIGHALAKRRAKDPFTVFVATTEPESELFLSIDNESGAVMLEEPSASPLKVVDEDVAAFLDRLTPSDAPPSVY